MPGCFPVLFKKGPAKTFQCADPGRNEGDILLSEYLFYILHKSLGGKDKPGRKWIILSRGNEILNKSIQFIARETLDERTVCRHQIMK